MTFGNGTLILIDYTAKVKDTRMKFLIQLLRKQQQKNIRYMILTIKYQPKLISIGEGVGRSKGLDDALVNTSVGDKKTIEVTPDKGIW